MKLQEMVYKSDREDMLALMFKNKGYVGVSLIYPVRAWMLRHNMKMAMRDSKNLSSLFMGNYSMRDYAD